MQTLTAGAVRAMHESNTDGLQAVVQVIDLKKVASENNKQDRYRILISDGVHYAQAMLATQLNHLLQSNAITKFHLIHVLECICNVVQNRRIVIILKLEPLGPCEEKIGSPVSVEDGSHSAAFSTAMTSQQTTSAPGYAPPPSAASSSFQQQHQPQGQYHQQAQQQQRTAPIHQQPPKQEFGGRGAVVRDHGIAVQPIDSLHPYHNNRWTIRARIVTKSKRRTYKNDRGEGSLFSVDLCDESGEIRGTFFNQVCDKFYEVLQADRVYLISSRGTLKQANKKFSSLNNDYEITFSDDTTFEKLDDDANAPKIRYNFVNIADLEGVAAPGIVDVIGVVDSITPLSSVQIKNGPNAGQPLSKRNVKLVDTTGKMVDLTLWGERAEGLTEATVVDHPVLALRAVRVSDYGGRSIGTTMETHMDINPDLVPAHELRGWYDAQKRGSGGAPPSFSSITSAGGGGGGGGPAAFRTMAQVKEMAGSMQNVERGEVFRVRALITFIKHDDKVSYPACPSGEHQNKVTQQTSNNWHCEKCNRTFPNCEYRYILSVTASDATGSQWLNVFNDPGKTILKCTADNLVQLKEGGEDGRYEEYFQDALFRLYNIKIRAKMETYQDEARMRLNVLEVEPVKWAQEGHVLLKEIKAMC